MATLESPKNVAEIPKALVKNMIFLATSGFGVVVALAWNEFIKAGINEYIAPHFAGNGIFSLFIYAVVVTIVAVVVIMQLSALEKRLAQIEDIIGKVVTNNDNPPHTSVTKKLSTKQTRKRAAKSKQK